MNKRSVAVLLIGLVLLLLAGCQAASEEGAATDATTEPTAAAASPTVAGETFENAVIRRDFPDPGIIRVGDTYYAYSTNAASRNVPLATSTDLVNWDYQADAMPSLPSWAQLGGSYVWAPEVIEIDGRYLRQLALDGLAAGMRGELPASGPRGGKIWSPRFFARYVAWHTLDHAWEIEDRAIWNAG